jgi:hypothetical protein
MNHPTSAGTGDPVSQPAAMKLSANKPLRIDASNAFAGVMRNNPGHRLMKDQPMQTIASAEPEPMTHALTLPNGSVLRNRLAKAAMSETLGT